MNHSLRVLHNIMGSFNNRNLTVQIVELLWTIRIPLVPPHHGILPFTAEVDHARHHQDQNCNKIKILLI